MTTPEVIADVKARADLLLRKAALKGDEAALNILIEDAALRGASRGALEVTRLADAAIVGFAPETT